MTDSQIVDSYVSQQTTLFTEVVGKFIAPNQPFALLDFPEYFNIGDSAIYLGELAFFDRHVGRCLCCAHTDVLGRCTPPGVHLRDGPSSRKGD